MAVTAKDGTSHHSASRASFHDSLAAGKGSNTAGSGKGKPDADVAAGDKGKSQHDLSHMDIGEVVAKHGPAHHVTIHHDHEGGTHHVTTHHGSEGHFHHSMHGSADEAHDHAKEAASGEATDDDEPSSAAGSPEGAEYGGGEDEGSGGGIPGLG